jgi:hypothetical protein
MFSRDRTGAGHVCRQSPSFAHLDLGQVGKQCADGSRPRSVRSVVIWSANPLATENGLFPGVSEARSGKSRLTIPADFPVLSLGEVHEPQNRLQSIRSRFCQRPRHERGSPTFNCPRWRLYVKVDRWLLPFPILIVCLDRGSLLNQRFNLVSIIDQSDVGKLPVILSSYPKEYAAIS